MDEEFITLMKTTLPQYIVQCFLFSGFDTPKVVAHMTTDGPGNSIDQIEQFILKHYPDEPSCYHMSNIKHTHVFTPGHRIRISDFIKDVKAQHVPPKRKLQCRDSSNKRVQSCNKTTDTIPEEVNRINTYSPNEPRYDLQKISDDTRKRILKWIQQSGFKFAADKSYYLKEHQDYMVKVKLNASNKPTVFIHHALCSKEYKLNEKVTSESIDKPTFMLSNWTGHIKRCVETKNQKVVKQQTISQFLPSPLNNVAQGTRIYAKQPAYDKSTQDETSATSEHIETWKNLYHWF